MQYNFQATVTPDVSALATALDSLGAGLTMSGALTVTLAVTVNTELPDASVASLTDAVGTLLSAQLTQTVTAFLVSTEN